ncbi:ankyrin repeat domain-containing protein [Photobacterium sp. 1_MG-2023]|uniref:ankyrin repeat domain-containing protein n=1 Tax=Photobacterium sp. 1_MG-2023 TaxID=3062646 RepID=UPI0026E18A5F|nr:ankyrin repeat domain-containing protein [Photobacterium sp. 1_MG-2023]MDO6709052.1 ankyrin repeat domain-containing protein [Photobacterium sp. 1_MG-2023]
MALEILEALDDADIKELEILINAGFDIYEITPKEDWTYLHKALMTPRADDQCPAESIQFLIEQGLDVNAIDSYGYTPLIYAVRQRNVPAMRLLLENGAKETLEHRGIDSLSALRMAIRGKPYQYDVVKVLLEHGADPDAAAPGGKSVREAMDIIAGIDPAIKALIAKY